MAEAVGRFYCGSNMGEVEERDLETGLPTGNQLDALLGEVSDLAVANSNELVAFSRGYAHWRLDGSGPVSRLVASQPAVVGYDETGRYLPTMDLETGRVTVRDVANGSALAELAQDEWPEWLGDGALVVFRGETEADLLDLDTGERRIPVDSELVGPSERMYPSRRGDGRAWAVIEGTGPYGKAAVEVDVHTGAVTSGPVPLPGTAYNLAPGPEPDTLWLNYQETDRGDHLSWDNGTQAWLALVDSNSGEVLREVDSVTVSAVGPQGEVVGSDYWGDHLRVRPGCHGPGGPAGRSSRGYGDAGVQRRKRPAGRDGR